MEPLSVLAILTFIKDVLEQVSILKDTIDKVTVNGWILLCLSDKRFVFSVTGFRQRQRIPETDCWDTQVIRNTKGKLPLSKRE